MNIKRAAAIIMAGAIAFSSPAYIRAEENVVTSQVTIQDNGAEEIMPILIQFQKFPTNIDFTDIQVVWKDNKVSYDVNPMEVDGIYMIPLRQTLEAMGYKITWNRAKSMIEISKDNRYTSVTIGENSYYFAKMAPKALSAAPVIVNQRTMVPVEFINEILKTGVSFDNGTLTVYDEEYAISSGYVYDIAENEDGFVMTVTTEKQTKESFSPETTDRMIVTIDKNTTLVNRASIHVGDFITVSHLPYMTMIYPAQFTAITVY